MLQPTEQIVQPTALRAIADLTETAVSYGARHLPMWMVTESGIVSGSLSFPTAPRHCDLDPWRLAIGVHAVSAFPFLHEGAWFTSDRLRFSYRDLSVEISVIYPQAKTASAVTEVAA